MNASDMVRLLTWHDTGANRNGRMFLPSEAEQFLPYHRYETERFTRYDRYKEREVTRPTFMEAHYNELMRFARIASWSGEARQVVSTPPVEDTELTAEDTKELDEFLSSFSRT